MYNDVVVVEKLLRMKIDADINKGFVKIRPVRLGLERNSKSKTFKLAWNNDKCACAVGAFLRGKYKKGSTYESAAHYLNVQLKDIRSIIAGFDKRPIIGLSAKFYKLGQKLRRIYI